MIENLTIVDDIDGFTGSENGVKTGIVKASGVLGAVFDLEIDPWGSAYWFDGQPDA